MGMKSASDGFRYDQASMFQALLSMNINSRKMDAERGEAANILKKLGSDPDLLSGNRAEEYAGFFNAIYGLLGVVSDGTIAMRNNVTEINAKYSLEVDKATAKELETRERAQKSKSTKLKGQ